MQLEKARRVLLYAFAIEEKYEILITNFLELEKKLLHVAATDMVRETLTYSEFFDRRSLLNVCLVNLLTAARLYLDQLPQDIAKCTAKHDAEEAVKTRCSTEYNKHFEYRFMEALRNHVQHQGIPIHFVSHDHKWTSLEENGFLEFYADIFSQRRYLSENEKFKKSILKETPEEVDLKAACRRYVESLSAINEFSRELINETVTHSRATIQSVHKRYAEIYPENLIGLSASEISDEQIMSTVPLLLDWDDVRIELQRRNTQLINLKKRYVTGKTR